MSALEWRQLTTKKPMVDFQTKAIDPLIADGYVTTRNKMYVITRDGEEYLETLGRVKMQLPNTQVHHTMNTTYDGAELKKRPDRPNAERFLDYPSRVSGRLFYRNGTVGAV
jgi:phosphoserine aminotransferase